MLHATTAPVRDDFAALAAAVLHAQTDRARYFPKEILQDAPWAILLDLYVSKARGQRTMTTDAVIASGAAHSTACRWIQRLVQRGLIEPERAPDDARRVYLRLTEEAVARLEAHFLAVHPTAMAAVFKPSLGETASEN